MSFFVFSQINLKKIVPKDWLSEGELYKSLYLYNIGYGSGMPNLKTNFHLSLLSPFIIFAEWKMSEIL